MPSANVVASPHVLHGGADRVDSAAGGLCATSPSFSIISGPGYCLRRMTAMRGRRLHLAIIAVLLGAAGLAATSALAASAEPRARLEDHFTREEIERAR